MKAAIVNGLGQTPVYGEFAEPVRREGDRIVSVTAAAISHLVKGRASGTHYSSGGQYPFIAGVDGVGKLEDGKRVYFVLLKGPYGAMAESAAVRPQQCILLPDDLDDITAAAIANPGMSSWAAFSERAKLKAGETVLINGATGSSGRLAVQIAKWMGAKKIIATGRNEDSLRAVAALGANVSIQLTEDKDALETSFKEQFAEGVDVVIDYLWGKSAESLLIAAAKDGPEGVPLRFVQVGSLSGADITLPSAVLRSSAIELMGSGIGSVPVDRLLHCIAELMKAAVPGGFKIANTPVPLSKVEQAWPKDNSEKRTVFLIG